MIIPSKINVKIMNNNIAVSAFHTNLNYLPCFLFTTGVFYHRRKPIFSIYIHFLQNWASSFLWTLLFLSLFWISKQFTYVNMLSLLIYYIHCIFLPPISTVLSSLSDQFYLFYFVSIVIIRRLRRPGLFSTLYQYLPIFARNL